MSLLHLGLFAVFLIGLTAVSAWYGASWRAVAKGLDDATKVRSERLQEEQRGAEQVAADPPSVRQPALHASTSTAGPPAPRTP